MGISTNYYTFYGIKHEYNAELGEFVEGDYVDAYDDEDLPTIIIDGMSGKYVILGKILFDSGDLRFGELEESYVEIDLNELDSVEMKYKQSFIKKFPNYSHLVNEQRFKLMTFVHYS